MPHDKSLARLDARFPSRRALVTGGASGLGLAVAGTLAVRGWHLGLLDLDGGRLQEAAARLAGAGAGSVWTRAVDTRDEPALRAAVDAFAAGRGGLDLAFNSAGVAVAGRFLETPAGDWDWVVAINLLGVAASCRAELPHMVAARAGLVVNVASAAGFVSGADMSAYNASKAAVIALSETLAQEHQADGVQVSVAMPGFFRTRLLEQARAPAAALGTARRIMHASNLEADAVAREILARVADGEGHVVLPREDRWLWRFQRLSPRWFQRFMVDFRARKEAAARARRG